MTLWLGGNGKRHRVFQSCAGEPTAVALTSIISPINNHCDFSRRTGELGRQAEAPAARSGLLVLCGSMKGDVPRVRDTRYDRALHSHSQLSER